MITGLYNKIERGSDKTLQTPAEYTRLARYTQHARHFLFQGPAPRHWLPSHIYLNVYMFVCLCVHMFLRELQILDWTLMANTSLHQTRKAKKKFVIKDQLPSYFNNKDKNLVYHLVTDLIVTTFLG